ncbi:2-aminoethylphosphonate ABC transporter substrate-binding protein [Pantoea agglomerans]|uniref:2-aminoethylphosphonate ABC transporter substrate-binding protein n=1 Tax=Enterobacter agglomerans TaxID=549 RepID=A0A379AEB8_ENTAG|nr:2-aminoethylphosphonate ABC transporter substrate-binding protein [Pantoea agglomerans]
MCRRTIKIRVRRWRSWLPRKAIRSPTLVYYGVSFGIQAVSADVVSAYKPANWDQIPAGMKDPAGKWVALHSGTMGFMVNVDALGGAPVPRSWDDLLKPEYKGMVGYLDPASAFVGYVAAVAVNQAKGGSLHDFTPAIKLVQSAATQPADCA